MFLNVRTDWGFQREMSYQERIIILSFIYFTSIVLQIETDAWSAQTNRVKELVFNITCSDRFNENEMQRWNKSKSSVYFFCYLTTLFYVLRETVWPSHSWEFLVTVCRPVLQILTLFDLFRPKNVIFHSRFHTRPLKSIPVFRPDL